MTQVSRQRAYSAHHLQHASARYVNTPAPPSPHGVMTQVPRHASSVAYRSIIFNTQMPGMSRKLASASWSLLALASIPGAAQGHHVIFHAKGPPPCHAPSPIYIIVIYHISYIIVASSLGRTMPRHDDDSPSATHLFRSPTPRAFVIHPRPQVNTPAPPSPHGDMTQVPRQRAYSIASSSQDASARYFNIPAHPSPPGDMTQVRRQRAYSVASSSSLSARYVNTSAHPSPLGDMMQVPRQRAAA